MRKRFIFAVLTLLLFLSNLTAYSLYDLFLGTEIPYHDARVGAMGGTGVAGGFTLMDSSINPANLYYLSDNTTVAFSYSLIKNSSSRAIPLWNFFDSYMDESTYARDESFYNELAMGLRYGFYISEAKINLALSMRPIVNLGASYEEEVRNFSGSDDDTYPLILAKNFIDSDGMLNSYNFLLNFGMPLPFDDSSFSVGAELIYAHGKHDLDRRIVWTDVALAAVDSLTDRVSAYHNKMDGIGTKFGLSAQVYERLRVGFAFTPKMSLKYEGSSYHTYWDDTATKIVTVADTLDKYILPQSMRFGILYMPRNPYRTNFQLDFEIISYSQLNVIYPENPENNKLFYDGYALYVGMEHYVGKAIPLRIGFSHKTAKQNRNLALPSVSIGTGFEILNNLQLDISGEYGTREYIDLDLFPDSVYMISNLWGAGYVQPKDRGDDNPDKVSESFLKVFTSLSYRF